MKTEIPLGGFRICVNHFTIHLALLIAQASSMRYFKNNGCIDHSQPLIFYAVHIWCFLAGLASKLLHQKKREALANFLSISCIPIYIWCIYEAHYYELSQIGSTNAYCKGKVDLIAEWYIIELRVFYAFIVSGIIFLMCASIFKVDKTRRQDGLTVKGGTNGDFVEKYWPAKIKFCRHSFELVMTLVTIIEFYSRKGQGPKFTGRSDTYLLAILLILLYSVMTASQNVQIFTLKRPTFVFSLVFQLSRLCLIAASTALLFTIQGNQMQFGFWILCELCIYVISSIYEIVLCFKPGTKKYVLRTEEPIVVETERQLQEDSFRDEVEPDSVKSQIRISHTERLGQLEGGSVEQVSKSEIELQAVREQSAFTATDRPPQKAYDRSDPAVSIEIDSINKDHQQVPHHEGVKTLKLKEDFYAIAFISVQCDVAYKHKVSPYQQSKHLYAIMWVWLIEVTLIVIIMKTVVVDQPNFSIQTPNVQVYVTRFIATLLMHMELIQDVKQGLSMLHYLNLHPEEFANGVEIAFLAGVMQCTGAFFAEAMNLFMLATRSSVELCITFFVAFHVLAEIDNIYCESISDLDLLEALEEPLVYKRNKSVGGFKGIHKGIFVVRKTFTFFYNTVYYYYLPYIVNFIPYFFVAKGEVLSSGH